ncbi:hypothetical protein K1T71_010834 [Dendrolimus kikuchii]|uniref:Uncharacterized protein n=1 Tax=Dendrolimus kikuchii TaxID=765133 RepID=A0ACC1CQ34_9NEOP|nr:hypothetical protein K1T71_010834 [Dendrolimus kikuchii]
MVGPSDKYICGRVPAIVVTEGWRMTWGGAGEGRCSCRCISIPRRAAAPAPRSPAARRPIAKFNAKVMRARLRLRAAMQERPAVGGRLAISASSTIALRTAYIATNHTRRVPMGHMTIITVPQS